MSSAPDNIQPRIFVRARLRPSYIQPNTTIPNFPSFPIHPTLNLNIPPPLLANLLMSSTLQRPLGVAWQRIHFLVVADLLGVRVTGCGIDLAGLRLADLFVGLLFRLWGLAAGVGGGHDWIGVVAVGLWSGRFILVL